MKTFDFEKFKQFLVDYEVCTTDQMEIAIDLVAKYIDSENVLSVDEDWAETHHELALMIEADCEFQGTIANLGGMGNRWQLSHRLTNEFMAANKDVLWGSDNRDWHEELEAFYAFNRLAKGEEGEKFYRKCSFTGDGMDEGWYFACDGTYASTQELADQHAKEIGYKDFNDLYEQNGGDEGSSSYWTSWDGDYYEFEVRNGVLVEIEED